ncbi:MULTISPECIES: translation initiation factor IF-6 [unclassified Thermoplasma]|uniref:translation initiation factor IF-6 n=1 Tax=unclassified Thermoplasma TaxID=2684908 RepID=UPI000D88AD43|nr:MULTISPECIES: translation initiation factor IF-6 [unclassified Thermoplasma]PYB69172.1 translation initiation factor IF-6 [Thermoplasma sp. Kam2015]
MIRKTSVLRSNFIGIYAKAWDDVAFITMMADDKTVADFQEVLQVDVRKISIDNSSLIGTMMVMNSNGLIVPYGSEIAGLGDLDGRNVLQLKDKINAIGNDIIANDHGAIIHKNFSNRSRKEIEDTLGVETIRTTIGNILTVGSAGILTSKGMLVNPETDEDELEFLKDFFKVSVKSGTANFGSIYVGASIVANSKGVLVGKDTTPIEMDRIDDVLS